MRTIEPNALCMIIHQSELSPIVPLKQDRLEWIPEIEHTFADLSWEATGSARRPRAPTASGHSGRSEAALPHTHRFDRHLASHRRRTVTGIQHPRGRDRLAPAARRRSQQKRRPEGRPVSSRSHYGCQRNTPTISGNSAATRAPVSRSISAKSP